MKDLGVPLLELPNDDSIAWWLGIGEKLNLCTKQTQTPIVMNGKPVKLVWVSAWWIGKCAYPLSNFIGSVEDGRNYKWFSVQVCSRSFCNRECVANLCYYASEIDWAQLIG